MLPLSTCDTVATETPASWATSLIVATQELLGGLALERISGSHADDGRRGAKDGQVLHRALCAAHLRGDHATAGRSHVHHVPLGGVHLTSWMSLGSDGQVSRT